MASMILSVCLVAVSLASGVDNDGAEETCALQITRRGSMSHAVAKTQKTCAVGDHVECPDENGTMCSGNQCCPRSTDGKTYPCPSAEQGWSQCESSAKVTNCLEQPHACCLGETAECLACQEGVTVQEYCAKRPLTESCPCPELLQAVDRRQGACAVGDHVECPDENGTMCSGNQCCPRSTYGKTYPCPSAEQGWSLCESSTKVTNCVEQSHACCEAMSAECLSCSAGQTTEEYCAENPTTEGCIQSCCEAITAECLSCSAGQTIEEYCAENPSTQGCVHICCVALTPECLGCAEGLTAEEYCTKYASSEFCPAA